MNENDINDLVVSSEIFFGPKDYSVDENMGLHKLIEMQAIQTPNNIAYKINDQLYTYAEINEKANYFASYLLKYTKYQKVFIPVLMERCIELPITLLAIMKIGCAFVPIDFYWPKDRIIEGLETLSNYPVGICKNCKEPMYKNFIDFSNIILGRKKENITKINVIGCDPIYALFTSGTTGQPKIAINLHKGIINRFLHMNKRYIPKQNDIILMTSNHAFDAAVWQLFWPQINGLTTIIPSSNKNFDIMKIINIIYENKVTITDFVPSVFNLLVDIMDVRKNLKIKLLSLRQLLIGGEAMNAHYIYKFKQTFTECEITNTYGPTEASIGTIFFDVEDEYMEEIPIGRPIDNVDILVLDDSKQLVNDNTIGELYLGGLCVGGGYINNNIKTKEVFQEFTVNNSRSIYYQTGDLVQLLPDGNLKYCGRKDRQVKIDGIRIELSEVEIRIKKLEYVKDVVVQIIENKNNRKEMVAYIILNSKGGSNCSGNIKTELSKTLPLSMRPSKYIFMKAFPLNSNGKIDTSALKISKCNI